MPIYFRYYYVTFYILVYLFHRQHHLAAMLKECILHIFFNYIITYFGCSMFIHRLIDPLKQAYLQSPISTIV